MLTNSIATAYPSNTAHANNTAHKNNKELKWQDELEAWVFSGVVHFAQHRLSISDATFAHMQAHIYHLLGNHEREWSQVDARWQLLLNKNLDKIPDAESAIQFPLLQLIRDYQLNPAQLFILCLVGLIESSHLLNLAMAELQAPDKAPRPSVHLLSAILATLFEKLEADNVLDISQQALVDTRVLELIGDVPVPLRRLQINPHFWSILMGRRQAWPQCDFFPENPEHEEWADQSILEQIPVLGNLLRYNPTFDGVIVRGNPHSGRGFFSQQLASSLKLTAINVPVEIWRNEPVFAHACRYARWLAVVRPALAPADTINLSKNVLGNKVPLAVVLGTDGAIVGKMLEAYLETPKQSERLACWNAALGNQNPELCEQLSASALLSARSIQRIAEQAVQIAQIQKQPLTINHIAEARSKASAEKLRLLAEPITRKVTRGALILPPLVEQALDAVVLRACNREALWENLGTTLKVTPNPGIRALFVGESGTGKTLAASYIATRLGAPLYRVDLSSVMNKYIGESEKNLSQLLDQAAAKDAVLLFDEADALFGKRSEGQENGERFANMLTNFLLTRIESHPGIVILTTNSRERIDSAFSRRLDTIVEFPFPGFEERLHLWQSHLGERGPGEAVYRHLASVCDLAGGQLRNVVLTAAVYAQGKSISNADIVEGLRAEYRKQGRDFPKKLESLPNDVLPHNDLLNKESSSEESRLASVEVFQRQVAL